ncbi:hypothetical protein K0M31_009396 [Melipona bicolor]|uniref:Uncharacterized protein n=1 Tax=Melipona bicolor TaxID=60889 RepID=A0AA40FNX7_9HYME|nr:hypothetical protein K0M31_009396 [Melipona bicolor]
MYICVFDQTLLISLLYSGKTSRNLSAAFSKGSECLSECLSLRQPPNDAKVRKSKEMDLSQFWWCSNIMQPLQIRSLCRSERWSSSDVRSGWVMVRGEQNCFRDHESQKVKPIPAMLLRPVNFRATSDSQMAYVGPHSPTFSFLRCFPFAPRSNAGCRRTDRAAIGVD